MTQMEDGDQVHCKTDCVHKKGMPAKKKKEFQR